MLTTWWSILHSRESQSLTTLRTTETHQETIWAQIKRVQTLHTPWSLLATPPWTFAIKLLTKSPLAWNTVFEGMSLLCHPLPGKAIELFFPTSPKTLSPRFNSALVPRGLDFGIRRFQMQKFQLSSVHGVRDNKPFPASMCDNIQECYQPVKLTHTFVFILLTCAHSAHPTRGWADALWANILTLHHTVGVAPKPPGKQGHCHQGLDISWRNWG